MILLDTSIWIDHLRADDGTVSDLLGRREILIHPFVFGEIAMGSIRHRTRVLRELRELPAALVAQDSEVEFFVTNRSLFGKGIGYLDAHLLVSTSIMPEVSLWTRDRRLHKIAESLGLAASLPGIRIH